MCDFKDKEAIQLAEKLQGLKIVLYKDNFGIIKDDSGYFFANFSDNFIVNLKTRIRGSEKDIFKLFDYYSRTGRIDLKLVRKKFKVVKKAKKVKKIEYIPFKLSKKNIEELMEF